jgi:hypothetical protein
LAAGRRQTVQHRRSGLIGPAPNGSRRRRGNSCRCPLPAVDFDRGRLG